MKPRTALFVASALAAIVAVPVVALIALGAYGESIESAVRLTSGSSDQLSIDPSEGLPGSAVRVTGNGWPPRADVDIFLRRQRGQDDSLKTRLASVRASRSGSFALELVIPPSLIGSNTQAVFVEAQAAETQATPTQAAQAEFKLVPYANEIAIRVIDGESGEPLSEALVELRDSLGKTIHTVRTSPDGLVSISDVKPGRFTALARTRDYLNGSVLTTVPETGQAEVSIPLDRRPDRRLYLPFMQPVGLGTLRVAGVDRSSGLRSDLTITVPLGQLGQQSGETSTARLLNNFQFLIPATSPGSSTTSQDLSAVQIEATFRFLHNWNIPIADTGQVLGPHVNYVGQTVAGEIALLVETGIMSRFTNLLTINPESGRPRLMARSLSIFDTAPVLSTDGSRFYILRRASRGLRILDAASGETVGRVGNLPRLIMKIADSPSGHELYFLTGLGDIYRADTVTGAVDGPIAQVPEATSIAVSGSGGTLFVVGSDLDSIVAVDLVDGFPLRIAPLPGSAYWIWADPDGPFLFAGHIRDPKVTIIHAESLHVAGELDFTGEPD
ncbi:MAG: carboxypeptidase-like regulatory domain-containing protein [Chloroflexi bacterium]|nr:carboxypeptidase-like regulatory domain-containing protein [Chloroflexota bacterium]MCY3938330.1 carboxypeptidase-like regulatory domain-containing protein [Chloroflexota bacterium]